MELVPNSLVLRSMNLYKLGVVSSKRPHIHILLVNCNHRPTILYGLFQVFNVRLGNIDIVENLDIFGKVGRAVAHDEYIPFKVKNKKLLVNGKKDDIEEGSVSLTLVKVSH